MNTIPCKGCAHFEQQYKYKGNRRVESWFGWCKKRSVYPNKEWDPSQPFDVDVKRVSESATLSKPAIVDKNGTVASCTDAVRAS